MVPVYYTLSFAFVTSRADDPQITEWAFSAARGDRAALETFIRATQTDVWRFVCYLADAGHADDLTQETFIRAMKSLPRFSGRASARTWLLSIARRVVVDQIRHDSSRPRLVAETDEQRIENPQRHEEQVELMMLIGALDTDRREALLLTQIMGLSYSEAAQVCDCPIGTIRSRVARARDELQAAHRADDHAV